MNIASSYSVSKHRSVVGLLLGLLCLAPAVRADEAPADIEDMPTPTKLTDLLPEGGIDAVQIDTWQVTEARKHGGLVPSLESFTRWSIRAVDGKLVAEVARGRAGQNSYESRRRIVFSAEGELLSYREVWRSRDQTRRDLIGKVEDGQLVIMPNPEARGVVQGRQETRRIPMKTFETTLPLALRPLIYAYHARAGHLGYRFATLDLTRHKSRETNRVEDIGTETVVFDGQTLQAHVLIQHRTLDERPEYTSRLQTYVTKRGDIFRSTSQSGDYTYTTRRATPEKVREQFGYEDNPDWWQHPGKAQPDRGR